MSKIVKIFILSIVSILFFKIDLNAQFQSGKLYISLKPEVKADEFFSSDDFRKYSSMLGEYKYIAYNPFKLPDSKLQYSINVSKIHKLFSELKRVYTLHYSSAVNPEKVARKLSKIKGIDYCEPVSAPKMNYIPNDTLLKNQYYLDQINYFESNTINDNADEILIGVVDSGIDYEHEELANSIYNNPGEMGIDNLGRSKTSNGIDDDQNGLIDDWRGWDFASSTGEDYMDNDPIYSHYHGTHVMGIICAATDNHIGIAGISKKVKVLPVKCTSDDATNVSVYNGYNGILYCALSGCRIINCSFGASNISETEYKTLILAQELGSLVIAAAGNDNMDIPNYPAAGGFSISVASVDELDLKSLFSNYNYTVDISAPGDNIMSTMPGGFYQEHSGTSFSAPVVSGVACEVLKSFPDLKNYQLAEHLRLSTVDIYDKMSALVGRMGTGRIDMKKSLELSNPKSVQLNGYKFTSDDENGEIKNNSKLTLDLTLFNVFEDLDNVYIKATNISKSLDFNFENEILNIGLLEDEEEIEFKEAFKFTLPEEVPLDYRATVKLELFSNDILINEYYLYFYISPSYKTIEHENLTLTINSIGNFGYNDYPQNQHGEGFKYLAEESLLYEGSFMLAQAENLVSDVARSVYSQIQDKDFKSNYIVEIKEVDTLNAIIAKSSFSDSWKESGKTNINIDQTVYRFKDPEAEKFIIISYDLENLDDVTKENVFAGLYFDWDISINDFYDRADFNNEFVYGYIYSKVFDNNVRVAMLQLSDHRLNYYAMDNSSSSTEFPGVYDGFYDFEKYKVMSSGIHRSQSSVTDASIVISAGPFAIPPKAKEKAVFAICMGENNSELKSAVTKAREYAKNYSIASGNFNPLPTEDTLNNVYPNPYNYEEDLSLSFYLTEQSTVDIELYDLFGVKVMVLEEGEKYQPGEYLKQFQLKNLSPGRYFLVFRTSFINFVEPINIIK